MTRTIISWQSALCFLIAIQPLGIHYLLYPTFSSLFFKRNTSGCYLSIGQLSLCSWLTYPCLRATICRYGAVGRVRISLLFLT
ncbi:hypothetical protein EV401DRAFT_1926126 [Pisolithus croceorrhizus]|nr:hypothetical protein EV401DRAFT_1926126 [Pisolithus croceorrhizus]